jgi:hypothetical protein
VEISHRDLTDSDAIDVLEASKPASGQVHSQLQILYKIIDILITYLAFTDFNEQVHSRTTTMDG